MTKLHFLLDQDGRVHGTDEMTEEEAARQNASINHDNLKGYHWHAALPGETPTFIPLLSEPVSGPSWEEYGEKRAVFVVPGQAEDFMLVWERAQMKHRVRLSKQALVQTMLAIHAYLRTCPDYPELHS